MVKLLEIDHLLVSFDSYVGRVQAVRDLSLVIHEQEIVGLVGESGCGKSVALQAVLGLLPRSLTTVSGTVGYQGRNLLRCSDREMRRLRGREIAMVFQDSATGLNPSIKVGRQIEEALRQHCRLSRSDGYRMVVEMLDRVGVLQPESRFHQYPYELSGGMRQRIMIAMAAVCSPKLLIADEPTTALDVTVQAQILSLLKDLQQQVGMSVLLISHDLGVIASLCQRVLVMYAGKVVEEGLVKDIFRSPAHPYTQALLHALPRLQGNKLMALRPIGGAPPDLVCPPSGCAFRPRCTHAMRICQQQVPHRETLAEGHQVACWLPIARRMLGTAAETHSVDEAVYANS